MSDSPILAIPEIAENQNNKYVTHNNAVKYLEQATQRPLANTTVGAGPWTVLDTEITRYFNLKASGGSADFDIVVPGEINAVNAVRFFCVINADTTYTATVKTDGAGTTVVLPPGGIALILQDHDDLTAVTRFYTAASDALPYDFGFFVPGLPDDAGTVMVHVATRAFTMADDFAGSKAWVAANPTATADFSVEKNESAIGTISINTSGVATFTTSGGAVSVAIGDRIRVIAPSPQDATLSDVTVTFRGTRV